MQNTENPYWEKRKHLKYYTYMFEIIQKFAGDAKSLIDIGSNGIPFIEELDWIPERCSLDKGKPYQSENATGIKEDFFTFSPAKRYDAVTCMQVLEHVEDPKAFANKLFEIADHVFLSVPYKWPAGLCKSHIHDMIDMDTVYEWVGRTPDFYLVVTEIYDFSIAHARRLICYYKNTE